MEEKKEQYAQYEPSLNILRIRTRLVVLSFIALFSVIFGLEIDPKHSYFCFSRLCLIEAFFLTLFISILYLTFYFSWSIENERYFYFFKKYFLKDMIFSPKDYLKRTNMYIDSVEGFLREKSENKLNIKDETSFYKHNLKPIKKFNQSLKWFNLSTGWKYIIFDLGLPFILGIVSLIVLFWKVFI